MTQPSSSSPSQGGSAPAVGDGLGPVPVAILGPTGYTGLELIEILLRHPRLRLAYLATARATQPRIDAEFPRLAGRLHSAPGGAIDPKCRPIDHDTIAGEAKLVFLCLPHEAAMEHAPHLLARGVKVVDLSAAYRLRDAATYARAYGHPHTDAPGLAEAVYGLTELHRPRVAGARLLANPGCYPTAAGLALAPLAEAGLIDPDAPGGVVVNAASGASGAGREAKPHLTLVEAGDNFSCYAIGTHRHQPEIEQTLAQFAGAGGPRGAGGRGEVGGVLFLPHLLPIERGILATIVAPPGPALAGLSEAEANGRLASALSERYAGEPFVTVREVAPTLRDVQRTNNCHLHARVAERPTRRVVAIAAIDNLIKGASGQAVQNANLMLGIPEWTGLLG